MSSTIHFEYRLKPITASRARSSDVLTVLALEPQPCLPRLLFAGCVPCDSALSPPPKPSLGSVGRELRRCKPGTPLQAVRIQRKHSHSPVQFSAD